MILHSMQHVSTRRSGVKSNKTGAVRCIDRLLLNHTRPRVVDRRLFSGDGKLNLLSTLSQSGVDVRATPCCPPVVGSG